MKFLALVIFALVSSKIPAHADETPQNLYDFEGADAATPWRIVNDGVMGGLSKGQFEITKEAQLRFYGDLSLENNGGFASVRSQPDELRLAAGDTIVVRVRGDGRTYNFNLFVPTLIPAFYYQAEFKTKKDKWIEIELPFDKFVPVSFGVTLDGPKFDPPVNGAGILLADKEPGPFELFVDWIRVKRPGEKLSLSGVSCEGTYEKHLQGVCVDDQAVYWSFTTTLVKTDRTGKVLAQRAVADHHGDLCCREGKLYVAVNLGKFNEPAGSADSWVYVYDAVTLEEVARREVQEAVHGAGGIDVRDGQFYVVGGLPDGVDQNYIYQYDDQFQFVRRHVIESGHTHLGIQTAAFAHNRWWLGCYGDPKILLVTDPDFRLLGRYEFNCSLGIAPLPDERLLTATGTCEPGVGCRGTLHVALPDEEAGLRVSD